MRISIRLTATRARFVVSGISTMTEGSFTAMSQPLQLADLRALLAIMLRGQDTLDTRSKLTKKYYLDRAQEYLTAAYTYPHPAGANRDQLEVDDAVSLLI